MSQRGRRARLARFARVSRMLGAFYRPGERAPFHRRVAFGNRARLGRQLSMYGSSGRPAIGFPKQQLVKMRYNTAFLLNPTNVTTVDYIFRANSIFDPDQSGIGHQPIGHDQWANFYETYCVVGSKILVRIVHDETAVNSTANATVGVLLTDTAALPSTTISTLQEQGLGSWRLLQGLQNGNMPKLRQKFSAKKFFNVTNIKDNQDRVGAAFGANPPAEGDAYFIVWAAPTIPGGNSPAAIEVSVQIEYSVLLSNPKQLPQS